METRKNNEEIPEVYFHEENLPIFSDEIEDDKKEEELESIYNANTPYSLTFFTLPPAGNQVSENKLFRNFSVTLPLPDDEKFPKETTEKLNKAHEMITYLQGVNFLLSQHLEISINKIKALEAQLANNQLFECIDLEEQEENLNENSSKRQKLK